MTFQLTFHNWTIYDFTSHGESEIAQVMRWFELWGGSSYGVVRVMESENSLIFLSYRTSSYKEFTVLHNAT